jgi:periplasmic copper chaperone A
MRKLLTRTGAVCAGLVAACMLVVTPASAHVTVNPREATQGGYAKLTFRMPNEKSTATTTTLEVNFPADAPIASVSVKPVPGWTARVTKSKLATPIKVHDAEITEAVSKIVWKANTPESSVQAGQFQEFDVSAGPLPTVDKIVFKALQTYSDGDIVRWIDEPAADGKEAEHPAPVLKLTKAANTTATAAAAVTTTTSNGRANLALTLGIAALIVASAGLGVALVGARRRSAS